MCKQINLQINQVNISFHVYSIKYMWHATQTLSVCGNNVILLKFWNLMSNISFHMFKTMCVFAEDISSLKIMYAILAIYTLLGALQVITAFIDTSNYKILIDQGEGNFTYWDAQCRGKL